MGYFRALYTALLITVFTGLIPLAVHAQSPLPDVTIPGTQSHILRSGIINRDYHISVAIPEGHTVGSNKKYPVFYILDGNSYFATAVQSYRVQRIGNELPEIIIVGIDYPETSTDGWLVRRAGELTHTRVAAFDKDYAEQYGMPVTSGEGASFMRVIDEEIIPMIEKTYPAQADRALFGHSLGGLFATHSLLGITRSFDRYIISSPSLWWDNEVAFTWADAFAAATDTLDATVMLSVGALEGPQMVPPMARMSEILKARDYKGLTLTTHIFGDETHLSVQPATLSRGMRVIYAQEIAAMKAAED